MAAKKIPGRFVWATDLLDLMPRQTILEIGAGAGLWAYEICSRDPNILYHGIDRSAAMIEKAKARNSIYIESGIARFTTGDFNELSFQKDLFDIIISFNVNFLLQPEDGPLLKIKSLLNKNGRIFILHQAPYNIDKKFAKPVVDHLKTLGFKTVAIKIKSLEPTSALAIISILD